MDALRDWVLEKEKYRRALGLRVAFLELKRGDLKIRCLGGEELDGKTVNGGRSPRIQGVRIWGAFTHLGTDQ